MEIVAIEKCYIAGGSGLIGSALIQELLLDPNIKKIISLGRRSLSLKNDKISEQITNFKDLITSTKGHEKAHLGGEGLSVAYCCLGSTIKKAGSKKAFFEFDHDYIIHFAEFCKNEGVNHFILVSSMGANSKSVIFYNKVKGIIEDDLQKLKFKRLSILRPSILIGKRRESRPLESLGQYFGKFISPFFLGPLRDFCPIEATTVAKKMKELSLSQIISEKEVKEYDIEIISNRDIF